jgi:hypothetical protein
MKTILQYIQEMPQENWDYYFGITPNISIENPFNDKITHQDFIHSYFKRGGKVEVLDAINLDFSELRFPNHINAVFFLGLVLYYNTSFKEKFDLDINEAGYKTFPFIWFLIALYHDNCYHIEKDIALVKGNRTLEKLYLNYKVENDLLSSYLASTSKTLFECCKQYFIYRTNKCKVVDHGIFGGIILFDRLVKIRRKKEKLNEDTLFWGEELETQYKLAAFAIAFHNIWIPEKSQNDLYYKYGLSDLVNFQPLRFNDFKFLYLLGIVDTLDPIKAFSSSNLSEKDIFSELFLDFTPNSIKLSCKEISRLDFKILIEKATSLYGWLDVDVSYTINCLEIKFN